MAKTIPLAALLPNTSNLKSHKLVSASDNLYGPLVMFGRKVAGNMTYEDALFAYDPFQAYEEDKKAK